MTKLYLLLLLTVFTSVPATATETSIKVLLFVIPDCPIVNKYIPEINRLHDHYTEKGVEFTLVYSGSYVKAAMIENHRKTYAIKPKGILDSDFEIAKQSGATITPEAIVYNRTGEKVYAGRIDDLFTDYGDRRRVATERNLKLALDEILASKAVSVQKTKAIGCLIEY